MKPISVVLITGFLGAGKTTVVNALLRHLQHSGSQPALLINEFGKVSVDSQLIDAEGAPIYEVNQGSIFCVCTRGQFLDSLAAICSTTPRPDVLVLEATGIAQTTDLSDYLQQSPSAEHFQVQTNMCVIDALNFHKVLQTLPAVTDQVQAASVCIINKTDCVSSEQVDNLEHKVRELNSTALILPAAFGEVDFEAALSTTFKNEASQKSSEARLPTITPAETVSLTSETPVTEDRLAAVIQAAPPHLLRAKGLILTENGPELVEWVQDQWTRRPYQGSWRGLSQLVLIGRHFDEKLLQDLFTGTEKP